MLKDLAYMCVNAWQTLLGIPQSGGNVSRFFAPYARLTVAMVMKAKSREKGGEFKAVVARVTAQAPTCHRSRKHPQLIVVNSVRMQAKLTFLL